MKINTAIGSRHISFSIRQRIERGGERLWQYADFRDLPFTAVAQALSRLARAGTLERLSKGLYYRSRATAFGKSRPNPMALQTIASRNAAIFPAGIAAANLLGFTTQAAGRRELATTARSLPRKLIGNDAIIHTRRPEAWSELSETDAALLDFLRRTGEYTELSPEQTVRKTLTLLAEDHRFEHLLKVADSEPPRVRAILGVLGEKLGKNPRALRQLKVTLNPLSRFDFGVFGALPNARAWQAKEPLANIPR
jgi:hypothetical protein